MKIISGGQTGADQAGLDAAIALGLDYGGYVPKGRKTERGPLSSKYSRMIELDSDSYPHRTLKNVLAADATLLFSVGKISGGTASTLRMAQQNHKPYLHTDIGSVPEEKVIREIQSWLARVKPTVLNIAGSRESKAPGIYSTVLRVLTEALRGREG
jgi:hypothetical protein